MQTVTFWIVMEVVIGSPELSSLLFFITSIVDLMTSLQYIGSYLFSKINSFDHFCVSSGFTLCKGWSLEREDLIIFMIAEI